MTIQEPLIELNSVIGSNRKYYIKGEPYCYWPWLLFCNCLQYKTTVSRGWGLEPMFTIDTKCSDCLFNLFLMPFCCACRESVSGLTDGHVYRDFSGSDTFKGAGVQGAVAAQVPLRGYSITNGYGWLKAWFFKSSDGELQYHASNDTTGENMLGIYGSPQEAKKGLKCCTPSFVPHRLCRGFPCWVLLCCQCPSQQTSTVVKGPVNSNATAQETGTLSMGIEKRCCLCAPCWRPVQGGVISVPENTDTNDLMAWALLWRSTSPFFTSVHYMDLPSNSNWKAHTPITKVEEMQ